MSPLNRKVLNTIQFLMTSKDNKITLGIIIVRRFLENRSDTARESTLMRLSRTLMFFNPIQTGGGGAVRPPLRQNRDNSYTERDMAFKFSDFS